MPLYVKFCPEGVQLVVVDVSCARTGMGAAVKDTASPSRATVRVGPFVIAAQRTTRASIRFFTGCSSLMSLACPRGHAATHASSSRRPSSPDSTVAGTVPVGPPGTPSIAHAHVSTCAVSDCSVPPTQVRRMDRCRGGVDQIPAQHVRHIMMHMYDTSCCTCVAHTQHVQTCGASPRGRPSSFPIATQRFPSLQLSQGAEGPHGDQPGDAPLPEALATRIPPEAKTGAARERLPVALRGSAASSPPPP